MCLFCWHPGSPSHHALRLFTLVFVLVMTLSGAPVRAESNEATAVHAPFGIEYAVPNGPRNLVAEAPGRIWYTATEAGGIGFLEVLTSTVASEVRYRTDFYGLGEKSEPYDLVYDEGVVWFTLRGIRSLGRIDVVTREIETFPLLSFGAAPTGIDVDPSGRLWIAQNNGRISSFDPMTETFTEYIMSDTLAQLPRIEDIDYLSTRNIWFTMPDANRVVNYNSVLDRFNVQATGELQPMGLTHDPTGALWVTAAGTSKVGRFTYNTNSQWVWHDAPTADGGPTGILIFNDILGTLQVWVTENKVGTIGRLEVVDNFEVVSREKIGPNNPAGNPWGIIRSADGHIWVADPGRDLLYELTEPYIHRVYITSVIKELVGELAGGLMGD